MLGVVVAVFAFSIQYLAPKDTDAFWLLPIVAWCLLLISFVAGVFRQGVFLAYLATVAEIAELKDNKDESQVVGISKIEEKIEKLVKVRTKKGKQQKLALWTHAIALGIALMLFLGFKSLNYIHTRNQSEEKKFAVQNFNGYEFSGPSNDLEGNLRQLLRQNGYELFGYTLTPLIVEATEYRNDVLAKSPDYTIRDWRVVLARVDYKPKDRFYTEYLLCTKMIKFDYAPYWKIELIGKDEYLKLLRSTPQTYYVEEFR